MAWILNPVTPGEADDPTKRAWYPTNRQGNPSLRYKRPVNYSRILTNDPQVIAIWGMAYADLMRRYQALIMRWWKAGLDPGGHTTWNAYAAAHPIDRYKGGTVTVNGMQWFDWFQRRSIAANQWNAAPYTDFPTYPTYPAPPVPLNYPDFPRPPWNPPAPPADYTLSAAIPGYIRCDITLSTYPNIRNLCLSFAPTSPPAHSTRNPHYQAAIGVGSIPPGFSGPVGIDFRLSQLYWPSIPGRSAACGLWFWDLLTSQPSHVVWTGLYL